MKYIYDDNYIRVLFTISKLHMSPKLKIKVGLCFIFLPPSHHSVLKNKNTGHEKMINEEQ